MSQNRSSAVRREIPTQALLRQLVDYDPDTGVLTWRRRSQDMFVKDARWQSWNSRFANKPAFAVKMRSGHLSGSIASKTYYAHRIIWKLVHGIDPEEIDHINGNPADNRLANLRNVSGAENHRNLKLPLNNTSGHAGVLLLGFGKWSARIRANGTYLYLGCFETFDEAVEVRRAAERQYGYHHNHGRRSA